LAWCAHGVGHMSGAVCNIRIPRKLATACVKKPMTEVSIRFSDLIKRNNSNLFFCGIPQRFVNFLIGRCSLPLRLWTFPVTERKRPRGVHLISFQWGATCSQPEKDDANMVKHGKDRKQQIARHKQDGVRASKVRLV